MTNQQADYLIKGGLVITGDGISRRDVLVKDGLIQRLGEDLTNEPASRVIDAIGKYVMPGIIDAHNHPVYADRVDTFSESAAFGGVTTIVPFIRNRRDVGLEETTVESIEAFMNEAQQDSRLDYGIHAILVGDDDVEDQVPQLIKMGVISFKMFMTYPRRGIMMPDDKMLKAMDIASNDGGMAMVHAENGYCIDHLVDKSVAEGRIGKEWYAPSQPRILELEAANRAATYASVTDCPLYIVHISAREMLNTLDHFKGTDLRLYGETCPQYLDLTNQSMLDHGALAKIGPPLREKEDNEAMWKGISTRLLDTIASDFCGYKKSQKYQGGQSVSSELSDVQGNDDLSIFEATFGGNWCEQMLSVAYQEGVNKGRISLPRLVQVMCENPAKIFGLYPRKGALLPGSDADIVLFDPTLQHTLSAEHQHTNADFTMFEGKEILGKAIFSMQRGEVIIEDGELKRPRGKAQFLPGKSDLATWAPKGHRIS